MSNNQVVKFDLSRPFNFGFPLTLKAGGSYDRVERDIRNQTWTWTTNPPVAAGGRLVGNYDLIDDAFSSCWTFKDGSRVRWMESSKVFALFKAHPEYFQLNEAAAYTSGVNGSKLLFETIDAGFLRVDAKFFDNRLLVTTCARYERTEDEGRGPKNDPNAIYERTSAGAIVRGANGRPVPVAGTALQLAQLQYQERGASSASSYGDLYLSFNSTYTLSSNLLVRAAYARTIGRPALSQILPGVTITDLATGSADPVITENNVGLKPWTADNWDLSLEASDLKGAVVSASVFRKDVSKFFTSVQRPTTKADLDRFASGRNTPTTISSRPPIPMTAPPSMGSN